MINLLIVDDEYETRMGLKNFLPWKDIGVDTVDVAGGGKEALLLAKELNPDIIIADIRMPDIDGITLAKEIRIILPECKIIFISAYSDKEYLKSAIHLKAINFIEKPIEIDEVVSSVSEVVKICIEEKKSQLEKEKNDDIVSLALNLMKREFALALIDNNFKLETISEKFKIVTSDFFNSNKYSTIIINVSNSASGQNSNFFINYLIDGVDRICTKEFHNHLLALKDNTHIIVHLCLNETMDVHSYRFLLEGILKSITNCHNNMFSVFISSGIFVNSPEGIKESYQTAVIALQKLFFFGYNHVSFYEHDLTQSYNYDDNNTKILENYLQVNNKELAFSLIDKICADILCHKNTNINSIKDIFINLIYKIIEVSSERGVVGNQESIDDKDFIWQTIMDMKTLGELKSYIIEKLEGFFDYIGKASSKSKLTFEILTFIHENYYNKNLSIKEISNCVYLTPAYICQVFKKETGKTINEYITEYRIQKAKEFLKNKQVKLLEISTKAGYSDPNYFTRLFKKHEGITPSDYRKKYFLV